MSHLSVTLPEAVVENFFFFVCFFSHETVVFGAAFLSFCEAVPQCLLL